MLSVHAFPVEALSQPKNDAFLVTLDAQNREQEERASSPIKRHYDKIQRVGFVSWRSKIGTSRVTMLSIY